VTWLSSRVRRTVLSAAAALAIPALAAAQAAPPRTVVSLNGGVQAAAGSLSDHFELERNIETATVDVKYGIKPGVLFDGGIGLRLWKHVGAGVAVSRVTGDNTAEIDASIPHPLGFLPPRAINGKQNRIAHAETGVHLQLQYSVAPTRRTSLVFLAGPSWLNLEHALVTDVEYDDSYPYDTATFRNAVMHAAKGSAVGFNAGADLHWMFGQGVGLGGLVRFTRATVDLPTGDNRRVAAHAGGVQVGIGIRIGF
jgi:hypothetical protein